MGSVPNSGTECPRRLFMGRGQEGMGRPLRIDVAGGRYRMAARRFDQRVICGRSRRLPSLICRTAVEVAEVFPVAGACVRAGAQPCPRVLETQEAILGQAMEFLNGPFQERRPYLGTDELPLPGKREKAHGECSLGDP